MAHPGGRPTKYKPENCDVVIEMMAEGKSWTAVACHFNTTREVLDTWAGKNPEFADAKRRGFQLAEIWWEKVGQEHLIYNPKGEQINTQMWAFHMKNRFGWRDKQEISGDPNAPLIIKTQASMDFDDDDDK